MRVRSSPNRNEGATARIESPKKGWVSDSARNSLGLMAALQRAHSLDQVGVLVGGVGRAPV